MAPRKVNTGFDLWLDRMVCNHKLTGREVAEKIGAHDSAVSRWRSGKGRPNQEAVTALADLFNVDRLRLAVRAGLVSEAVAGVPPAEMPEPEAAREAVRNSIRSIAGLTALERQALLEKYDELSRGVTA